MQLALTYLQHINHNMSIFDRLLSVIAPYECLGCRAEGSLLCDSCNHQLPVIPPRCYRCRKVSPQALTCRPCRSSSRLYSVRAATIYTGLAKDVVWHLKFHGAQAVTKQMAKRMLRNIDPDVSYVIVPVPTASSRIRRRGYDQAVLLAKELSKLSGQTYMNCLRRTNQSHQVGARRSQRLAQLKGAFRVVRADSIHNANILLIDDVVTTGSTLESAATLLRRSGARRVSALVFAQP